jgi:hypothetical protein
MVTQGGDKDLSLVFKATEGIGVDYAVAVPLEICSEGARFLPFESAPTKPAFGCIRREPIFRFLYTLPNV